jgi:hypothetical protein
MGWSRVASAIEVQMVPGDHSSCVSTHVKVLVTRMKTYLETMQTNKAGALCARLFFKSFRACCGLDHEGRTVIEE